MRTNQEIMNRIHRTVNSCSDWIAEGGSEREIAREGFSALVELLWCLNDDDKKEEPNESLR